MKRPILITMTCCTLLFISNSALAAVYATYCNGCNTVQTSTEATKVANVGRDIVYVFNKYAKSVSKYQVDTYREDTRPFTILKEAYELPAEQDVKDSFAAYVDAINQADGSALILPPNSPVHSSAGALLGPAAANQAVLNQMNNLPFWTDLTTKINIYVSAAVNKSIPFADLVIDDYFVTVQYPDGSSQKYKVTHLVNIMTGSVERFVSPLDNTATDQNGNVIPQRASQLIGERFDNIAGSISDWIEYIRSLNISIVGATSPLPSTVTCSLVGTGEVFCEAKP